jgi:predicted MFS family arabinose efflux permease
MAFSLLLMAAGWLGLAFRIPAGYGRWGAWLALLASLVMVAGNAAEFYLFRVQPYGNFSNQRTISWTAFLLGSQVLDIGATIVGVAIWRWQLWPRWIGMLLMMSLPLDILAFFTFSPFLGPALMALVVGWLLVRSNGSDDVQLETVT